MRRRTFATVLPLFAVFCGALPGSAAAATGQAPNVSGGFPPAVGVQVTAAPSGQGDSVAWASCSAYTILSPATATNGTYTFQSSDIGSQLCAYELNSAGLVVGISDPVGPVEAGPSLSGAGAPVTEGQTLTVTPSTAWPSPPSDSWYDCDASGQNCVPVASGASGTMYVVSRSDVGSTIAVLETEAGGTPGRLTTPPTGLVSATPPTATSSPTVSGAALVGDTLTAAPGGWSNQPTSYTYQWERCSSGMCTAIAHATSATYVPVDADVGDTLEVLVTGVVDGVAGTAYPSYPTNAVAGISVSPPPIQVVGPVAPVTRRRASHAAGRLTATMRWSFRYAPRYTEILALAVDGAARRSTIATECTGKGCPFRRHRVSVPARARCRKAAKQGCRVSRTLNLQSEFNRRRLGIGARVTVMITRAHDIGKYYGFVVRARRAPSVRISCLAPGSTKPGKGCSGG